MISGPINLYERKTKSVALDVINLEIKALKRLKTSINSSFVKAVDLLVNCQSEK